MIVHPMVLLQLLVALFILPPGRPSFEAQVIDNNVAIGYGLAIGDVDGDRKPDILLADKKQFVWYRNGDWKRFVLADSLTRYDNVCIAARDIDGDGRVEVAVGAQWNPGETSDTAASGAVYYLVPPADRTKPWTAVALHHEPTVHRMQWVRMAANRYALVVAPLHGRGNRGGSGAGARLLAYRMPADPARPWPIETLEASMHLTHNFDVSTQPDGRELLYLAGKEGIRLIDPAQPVPDAFVPWPTGSRGPGEVRRSKSGMLAAIEPMHGNELVVYPAGGGSRQVLDSTLREGHALALGDMDGSGREQVIAGWRNPDNEGKVGVRIYTPQDAAGTRWTWVWVDENGMACEDLKIADLNGDGRPDIVAAGRATHNLKVYWNR